MRLIRLRIFWVLVFGICLLGGNKVAAISTGWLDGEPTVVHSAQVDSLPPNECRTTYVMHKINGERDDKKTCIDESGPLRLGYYISYGNYQFVVGFGVEQTLYKLEGLACDNTCVYSEEYDTLAARVGLISNSAKSMIIFRQVSQRIQQRFDTSNRSAYFTFNSDAPDFIFKSLDGYPWPINGLAVSKNGKWLAAEVRQRGVIVVNLLNLNIKRITNFGYSYGYGFDPTVQVAVDDAGDTVALTGESAGFRIYSNITSCGDYPNDDSFNSMTPLSDSQKCGYIDVDASRFIARFYMATHPRFNRDGSGLRFYAASYDGEYRDVYIKAAGYYPIGYVKLMSLGDSYTSGEGEDDDNMYLPYTDTIYENCHTSGRSYVYETLALLGYRQSLAKNVACSGAVTNDILGLSDEGEYMGQGDRLNKIAQENGDSGISMMRRDALMDFVPGRIPQLDFISEYYPDSVLVGIGGNDIDLVGKLKSCMKPGTCKYVDDLNHKGRVALEIRELYYKLEKVYAEAIKASPNSLIYAVGYPQIISITSTCDLANGVMFNYEERVFMRETIHYINQVIRAAATDSGIAYVDIEDAYGDAVLCGPTSKYAMNGLTSGNDVGLTDNTRVIGNESFHPNPYGHQLAAKRIAWLFPNLTNVPFCENGRRQCPVPTPPPQPSEYWIEGLGLINPMLTINLTQKMVSPRDSLDKTRNINLSKYSFESNSTVSVDVYSDKTNLGEFAARADGSFGATVYLPETLEYGYHKMVVSGTSYTGHPVEYYETIFLAEPEKVVVTPTPTPAVVGSTQDDETPANDTVADAELTSEVLGESDDKSNPLKSLKLVSATDEAASSQGDRFWYVLYAGSALTALLVGRLLYKRRRRTTI